MWPKYWSHVKLITLYRTSNENKTIFENQNQRWKYYRRSKDSQQFSTTVENLIAPEAIWSYFELSPWLVPWLSPNLKVVEKHWLSNVRYGVESCWKLKHALKKLRVWTFFLWKMSGSEADEANLASIFGGNSAQASRIPEDLRPILLNRWSSLRQQLDASRPSVAALDESGGDKSTSDPSKFLFFLPILDFMVMLLILLC